MHSSIKNKIKKKCSQCTQVSWATCTIKQSIINSFPQTKDNVFLEDYIQCKGRGQLIL